MASATLIIDSNSKPRYRHSMYYKKFADS